MAAGRAFLSVILFCMAVFLLINALVATPVDIIMLMVAIGFFVGAHVCWPKKTLRYDHPFLDMLAVIIELPVGMLLWLVRRLIRILQEVGESLSL